MTPKIDILSLSKDALRDLVTQSDPAFRSDQIYRWLWKQGVRSFDEMTNVPESLRSRLSMECSFNDFSVSKIYRDQWNGAQRNPDRFEVQVNDR